MECKWCGKSITNPNARFCPGCGKPLDSATPVYGTSSSPKKNGPAPKMRRTADWDSYSNPNGWLKWLVLGIVVLVVAIGGLILLNVTTLKGDGLWEALTRQESSTQLPDTVYSNETPTQGQKDLAVSAQETPQPAAATEAESTGEQVVLHNGRSDAMVTVDGRQVQVSYSGQDILIPRSSLPDVAQVRVVAPTENGWETAAVWYNYRYGNELTLGDGADYGAYQACEQDGLAQPSAKVVDVLTWAYYRGFLQAINDQSLDPMVYSTQSNTNDQTRYVFSDANRQNTYDLGDFSAVSEPQSIQYDSGRVVYNASFRTICTDRSTGDRQEIYNHRTIELCWEDGVWKVNRIAFLSDEDFAAGRYADLR